MIRYPGGVCSVGSPLQPEGQEVRDDRHGAPGRGVAVAAVAALAQPARRAARRARTTGSTLCKDIYLMLTNQLLTLRLWAVTKIGL